MTWDECLGTAWLGLARLGKARLGGRSARRPPQLDTPDRRERLDFVNRRDHDMAPRPSLDRLATRPTAGDWGEDELVSLAEAAALFFPSGPLSAASLRAARRRGELACAEVCGRTFTTPRAVRAMSALSARVNDRPGLERQHASVDLVGASALEELRRRLRV